MAESRKAKYLVLATDGHTSSVLTYAETKREALKAHAHAQSTARDLLPVGKPMAVLVAKIEKEAIVERLS